MRSFTAKPRSSALRPFVKSFHYHEAELPFTLEIELFVDDPVAVHRQDVAAGAIEKDPVREHTHTTAGPSPIKRMLQGAVLDPFGHIWLIGKILE